MAEYSPQDIKEIENEVMQIRRLADVQRKDEYRQSLWIDNEVKFKIDLEGNWIIV